MANNGAQTVVLVSRTIKCPIHTDIQALYVCEDCDDVLACVRCVTSVHKKHGLVDIKDFIDVKKENIEQYVKHTMSESIPRIEKVIEESERNLSQSCIKSKENIERIGLWCDELKTEIDNLAARYTSIHKQTNAENSESFQKFKFELQCKIKSMEKSISQCQVALESGIDLDIMYVFSAIVSQNSHQVEREAKTFTETNFDFDYLKCDLMNELQQKSPYDYEDTTENIQSNEEQPDENEEKEDEEEKKTTHTESYEKEEEYPTLLDKAFILSSFVGFEGDFITVASNSTKAWVDKSLSSIALVNCSGSILQEVRSDSYIRDISFSSKSGILWMCCDDKTVRKVISGLPKVIFRLDMEPDCICITGDDSVLIGVQGAILKHDIHGTQLQSTHTDATGQSLLQKPHRISECDANGDLAIVDKETHSIVVLNRHLALKFKFQGIIAVSTESVSFKTGYKPGYFPFHPSAACFDPYGHLLIADYDNKQIVVVNGSGKFLHTIHSCNQYPKALCVQGNCNLWVAGHNSRIQVLEYMKRS